MSGVQQIEIIETDAGSRLDRWFKRIFPHVAHGRVEKLLRTGQLRVDGKRAKGNHRLEAGQIVRVPPLPDPTTEKKEVTIHPADVHFMRSLVIYEDEDLIALNKPSGLAVQGGTKTSRHIDGMLPALGEGCRLIHRLDRDTSGVLLIAKSARAAAWAGRAFQSRRAEKIYWGISNGVPKPGTGEIKGYIAKGISDDAFGKVNEGREIMVAVRHGAPGAKHARTLYQTVAQAGQKAGWVVMQPLTGRTHQLRLHMQLLGAPLVGDPKYLTDRPMPGGLEPMLHLHARSIMMPHPDGHEISVTAPLPDHMSDSFQTLGFDRGTHIPDFEDLDL
ncbi:pseudouridine synthase [Fretibacter rubidus]|uniref:RluA family pseudouridine synthase n=1 Tax=Fretibacter rubidus TaxID=570162 RepID=UPI00352ACE89